jgi:hypothetical protein
MDMTSLFLHFGSKFFCDWGKTLEQGCQIFSWHNIPKWGKYTKLLQYIPNGREIGQMALKCTIAGPSKIYPNCYFWFENIPSGNPALELVSRGN